jgi:tetratricopeptide (TPR) repeat protein
MTNCKFSGRVIPRENNAVEKKNDNEYCQPPLLKQAIDLHQQAAKGDKEAVNEAYKLLNEIRIQSPQNNLVNAYYGSVITLMGRDAVDPMKRFEKTLKGLKILDQAVQKEPENIQIRILRANICFRLPEMYFHRTTTAIEDYNYLLRRHEQDPNIFPEASYYQFLYDLGNAYQNIERKNDAEVVWEKLRAKTKGTQYNNFFLNAECSLDPEVSDTQTSTISKVLSKGARLHREALMGDQAAINTAVDFFAKASLLFPDEILLEAYHADCLSLVGRCSQNSMQMFSSAIKAIKTFDNIVNNAPENIPVRLLRANHSLRIPEGFFHRTAGAIADYEYIMKYYDEDHSILPEEEYCRVLYDLGTAYCRLGLLDESESIWRKLLSKSGGVKFKDLIDEQLQKNIIPNVPKDLSPANDKQAFFQEAVRLHEMGVAGSKEAAELGLELWEKANEYDPTDPIALAYYGSCLALMGRYADEATTIFGNAIKGLKLVNQAVSMDENNVQTRLLRAFLSYSLPDGFFHLMQSAMKDFQFVKQAYERNHQVLSKEVYHQVLYNLGEGYHRSGHYEQAQETWNVLLNDSPAPKYKDLLKTIL